MSREFATRRNHSAPLPSLLRAQVRQSSAGLSRSPSIQVQSRPLPAPPTAAAAAATAATSNVPAPSIPAPALEDKPVPKRKAPPPPISPFGELPPSPAPPPGECADACAVGIPDSGRGSGGTIQEYWRASVRTGAPVRVESGVLVSVCVCENWGTNYMRRVCAARQARALACLQAQSR